MNNLKKVFMSRDDLTSAEADSLIREMRKRVNDGEDPEEVLFEEGLEPDYLFDLI